MSPWTRLAVAGELPLSVSHPDLPDRADVADTTSEEATRAYVPMWRRNEYAELDCICGETHRGWTHREAPATSAPGGPLRDRLRLASYKGYRHSDVECVCGEVHAGWEHLKPPRPSDPIGGVRTVVPITVVDAATDGESDTKRKRRAGSRGVAAGTGAQRQAGDSR